MLLGQGWSVFTLPGVKRIAELEGDFDVNGNSDAGDFGISFIIAYLPAVRLPASPEFTKTDLEIIRAYSCSCSSVTSLCTRLALFRSRRCVSPEVAFLLRRRLNRNLVTFGNGSTCSCCDSLAACIPFLYLDLLQVHIGLSHAFILSHPPPSLTCTCRYPPRNVGCNSRLY